MLQEQINIFSGSLLSPVFNIIALQVKFAVDRALDHKKYETGDIGQSLLRVLEYYTMKNQFDEVCPELAEIGVTKIEVTSEGLKFHGAIKHDSDE